MSVAQTTFAEIYSHNAADAAKVIPFDPKWNNGTGYLDGAVAEPVESGKIKVAETSNARRVVLIGTEIGTIVMFERFSAKEDGERSHIIVANTPRALAGLAECALSSETIDLLAGNYTRNFGEIIAAIRAA